MQTTSTEAKQEHSYRVSGCVYQFLSDHNAPECLRVFREQGCQVSPEHRAEYEYLKAIHNA